MISRQKAEIKDDTTWRQILVPFCRVNYLLLLEKGEERIPSHVLQVSLKGRTLPQPTLSCSFVLRKLLLSPLSPLRSITQHPFFITDEHAAFSGFLLSSHHNLNAFGMFLKNLLMKRWLIEMHFLLSEHSMGLSSEGNEDIVGLCIASLPQTISNPDH